VCECVCVCVCVRDVFLSAYTNVRACVCVLVLFMRIYVGNAKKSFLRTLILHAQNDVIFAIFFLNFFVTFLLFSLSILTAAWASHIKIKDSADKRQRALNRF
jgi:hypothetical protein